MMATYEFSVSPEAAAGKGYVGWEITLQGPEGMPDRRYGFNETDGVHSALQAVQAALANEPERCVNGAAIEIHIAETRILVTTEICMN